MLSTFAPILLASALLSPTAPLHAQTAEKAAEASADAQWKALQDKVEALPKPPAATAPEKEREAWKAGYLRNLRDLSEETRSFYLKHAGLSTAAQARALELEALVMIAGLSDSSEAPKIAEALQIRLKEPGLTKPQQFNYRLALLQVAHQDDEQFAKDALKLAQDFPEHPNAPQLVMMAVRELPPSKAVPLLEKFAGTVENPMLRMSAESMLTGLKRVGKPLELKVTTVDGKEIDLQKLKGKVVLVNFWATWCPPCIAAIPEEKEVYSRFKDQGFEILGISLDHDLDELKTFLKKNDIPWPNSTEAKGFQGVIPQKFGITAAPTLWLVDRHGILRDVNVRTDLAKKVQALLNEK